MMNKKTPINIYNIYLDGYLCSEEQYLRGGDKHLSFLSYICAQTKKGYFTKEEIQPVIKEFLKCI